MNAPILELSHLSPRHRAITEALRELEAGDTGLTGVQRDFIREWINQAETPREARRELNPDCAFALPDMFGRTIHARGEFYEEFYRKRLRPTEEAIALLLSFNRCPSCVL